MRKNHAHGRGHFHTMKYVEDVYETLEEERKNRNRDGEGVLQRCLSH